jgi:hypothetical protein
LQHPVEHLRVVDQELLELRSRQHQALQRPERDDIGDRRLAEQDRRFAEEVAAGQLGALGPVDDDAGLAVEDNEEARAGEALAEDARTAPPPSGARPT